MESGKNCASYRSSVLEERTTSTVWTIGGFDGGDALFWDGDGSPKVGTSKQGNLNLLVRGLERCYRYSEWVHTCSSRVRVEAS